MSETRPEPLTTEPEAGGETEAAAENAAEAAKAGAAEDVAAERDELKDQLLRALAETENLRRRAARERDEAAKYAIANFARDVVGLADDLGRALDNVPDDLRGGGGPAGTLIEGIEMTRRNLQAALERHGITRIDPMSEKFDHNLHEAMFEVETGDIEPGTVVQVIQFGYRIHDRLLRPARVGVAKRPPSAPSIDTEA